MTGKTPYRPFHFPDFDAVRWIAFFMVFLQHSFFTQNTAILSSPAFQVFYEAKSLGHLGIDLFFVLSSFLITYKILEEYGQTGDFRLMNFYIRRTLRIWPLYFFIVFLGFGLVPVLAGFFNIHVSLPGLISFFTFTANYYFRFHGDQYLFFLIFLWSISIEEQFYLVWALNLRFFKQFFLVFLMAIVILSCIYYGYHQSHETSFLYFDSLIYLPDFAAGAFFAWIAHKRNHIFNVLSNISVKAIYIFYAFMFLLLLFYRVIFSFPGISAIEKPIIGLTFAFVLFEQTFSANSFFKLRNWKKASGLGIITYGLYCYHGVIITLTIKLRDILSIPDTWLFVFILFPTVTLLLTMILSFLSYRYFESFFLVLKSKFLPGKKPQF